MLYKRNPQLNRNGELIHLLSTEGLSRDILTKILDTASQFVSVNDREVKKVPLLQQRQQIQPHLKLSNKLNEKQGCRLQISLHNL